MPSQGDNYRKQRRVVCAECRPDRQPRWDFARPPLALVTSLLRLVIIGAVCLTSDGDVVPPEKYYAQRDLHLPPSKRTVVGYEPVSTYERSVLCTIGTDLTRGKAYPPDGVCRWIAFTHVRFNLSNRQLLPSTRDQAAAASWATFVSRAAAYNLTHYVPSIATRSLLELAADPNGPRALNKTLAALKMFGLAVLNARVTVNETWQLSRSLNTMAAANPGSFLALGLSLVGLSDRTAARLVPTELLDALVTPLSLFVLETHLPVPGAPCRAGFTTSREPYYGQRDAFTLRGARDFLTQPALKYVDARSLGRCISILAGALQFNLAQNWSTPPPPGAPCRSWQVTELKNACSTMQHESSRSGSNAATPIQPTFTITSPQRDPPSFAGLRGHNVEEWLDSYNRALALKNHSRVQDVIAACKRLEDLKSMRVQPAMWGEGFSKDFDLRAMIRLIIREELEGHVSHNLPDNRHQPPSTTVLAAAQESLVPGLRDLIRDELAAVKSDPPLPTVGENTEAVAMWGYAGDRFFSFESQSNILKKVKPLLLDLAIDDEVPTCVAVYSVETDALHGQCSVLERYDCSMAYSIYDLLWYLRLPAE
ncbi:uncharacterized protein LOC144161782 [Haemaphysalis longicornis]